MIGTIRKHSAWLWVFIITLTIISFVWWGASPAGRNARGGGGGSYGVIYGREVTAEEYSTESASYAIEYWLRNRQWPSISPRLTQEDIYREVYFRILFHRAAERLGIHVGPQETARMAQNLLYSLSQGRQPATLDDLRQLLQTQRYTLADLQRTLQEKLETDQLEQIKGMAGALITPQEVSDMYDHDHQQYVAEAVFFPVTNYLARVQAPAAVVAQFYTNYMALYREPVRVQVNYVFFGISNYLAQAKLEWSHTNFEDIVTGYYNAHLEDFINEKTPEAAKVKIREELVRERAAMDAHGDANVFASKVFGQVQAGDLSVEAKKAGYVVRTSRPFSAEEQPADLEVNPGFVKEAFKLNAETPAAGPLATTEGFYVISLAQQFPSRIPEFTEIRGRVEQDYRGQQALRMAQDIGTNFAAKVAAKVASGGTFAQAAAAFGAPVVALPVFSLSTQPEDAPELGDQMQLESLKQTAFATLPGKVSGFVGTGTGGFVLHVKSIQPAEADKKAKNLPDFTAELRRMRINSAFNLWLESECNREFRGIPLLQPKNSPAAAGR